MSAPMRKPRIDRVEIAFNDGVGGRFVGPRKRLKIIRTLLTELDFEPVSGKAEARVPWREMAESEIVKFGEPGLALKGARAREGLSQSELARKLGIPQSNLSKMESGRRPIGKKMAVRLARILKTDYRVFL